jgi:hypothetical protein
MKLLQEIQYGQVPDLLKLTKVALRVIQNDLKRMITLTVDTKRSDYASFTGIQIHGPEKNYIWPSLCYATVKGNRMDIDLN